MFVYWPTVTVCVAEYVHVSVVSRMLLLFVSPLTNVGLKSSAVFPTVPLSSLTTTFCRDVPPVLRTVYVNVAVVPTAKFGPVAVLASCPFVNLTISIDGTRFSRLDVASLGLKLRSTVTVASSSATPVDQQFDRADGRECGTSSTTHHKVGERDEDVFCRSWDRGC